MELATRAQKLAERARDLSHAARLKKQAATRGEETELARFAPSRAVEGEGWDLRRTRTRMAEREQERPRAARWPKRVAKPKQRPRTYAEQAADLTRERTHQARKAALEAGRRKYYEDLVRSTHRITELAAGRPDPYPPAPWYAGATEAARQAYSYVASLF